MPNGGHHDGGGRLRAAGLAQAVEIRGQGPVVERPAVEPGREPAKGAAVGGAGVRGGGRSGEIATRALCVEAAYGGEGGGDRVVVGAGLEQPAGAGEVAVARRRDVLFPALRLDILSSPLVPVVEPWNIKRNAGRRHTEGVEISAVERGELERVRLVVDVCQNSRAVAAGPGVRAFDPDGAGGGYRASSDSQ